MLKKIISLTLTFLFILSLLATPSFAGTGGAEAETVELNSGAERNGDFISVNEDFETPYGTFRLILTGLKDGNRDAVIKALEDNYNVQSETGLKLVDDAFPDAEKWDNEEGRELYWFDVYQCWAASASNMLWISGWTKGLSNPVTGGPFTSEDDVFEYYTRNFTDNGSDVDRGIDWFFTGNYYLSGSTTGAGLLHPDEKTGGLKKSFVSSLSQEQFDLTKDYSLISQLERVDRNCERPAVFQGGLGNVHDDIPSEPGHSVTLAGVITDPSATDAQDRYKAVIIIDSDNDAVPDEKAIDADNPPPEQKYAERSSRANSYSVYPLRCRVGADGVRFWEILGYSSIPGERTTLSSMDSLALPSDELIKKCTETEGTMNVYENVDFTFDYTITTDSETPVTTPSELYLEEAEKTEFSVDEAVRVNVFIANRASVSYSPDYEGFGALSIGWRVENRSDGTTVAEGSELFDGEIYFKTSSPFMFSLNEKDGKLTEFDPGDYTVILTLNADRAVREAYYLNNTEVRIDFTVLPARDDPKQSDLSADTETTQRHETESPDNADAQDNSGGPSKPTGDNVTLLFCVALFMIVFIAFSLHSIAVGKNK